MSPFRRAAALPVHAGAAPARDVGRHVEGDGAAGRGSVRPSGGLHHVPLGGHARPASLQTLRQARARPQVSGKSSPGYLCMVFWPVRCVWPAVPQDMRSVMGKQLLPLFCPNT